MFASWWQAGHHLMEAPVPGRTTKTASRRNKEALLQTWDSHLLTQTQKHLSSSFPNSSDSDSPGPFHVCWKASAGCSTQGIMQKRWKGCYSQLWRRCEKKSCHPDRTPTAGVWRDTPVANNQSEHKIQCLMMTSDLSLNKTSATTPNIRLVHAGGLLSFGQNPELDSTCIS